jgi:hypothetical protein
LIGVNDELKEIDTAVTRGLVKEVEYVVTAFRDSPDAWGCTDYAIGFCAADVDIKVAARNIVTAYWKIQLDGWGQNRWTYLFDEGLIDATEAEAWAEEVWGKEAELGHEK